MKHETAVPLSGFYGMTVVKLPVQVRPPPLVQHVEPTPMQQSDRPACFSAYRILNDDNSLIYGTAWHHRGPRNLNTPSDQLLAHPKQSMQRLQATYSLSTAAASSLVPSPPRKETLRPAAAAAEAAAPPTAIDSCRRAVLTGNQRAGGVWRVEKRSTAAFWPQTHYPLPCKQSPRYPEQQASAYRECFPTVLPAHAFSHLAKRDMMVRARPVTRLLCTSPHVWAARHHATHEAPLTRHVDAPCASEVSAQKPRGQALSCYCSVLCCLSLRLW